MHKITKSASFCYGHRLADHKGKCKNLHGHNGTAEVTLSSATLDSTQMVADFGDLGRALKQWLDENFDHKVILCSGDPLLKTLKEQGQQCFETAVNPTAEIMAQLIFKEMKALGFPVRKARVWETATSYATYSEDK
ncbi:MAG: 6-pyruvoyl tetrahydrobiopterin synthase [Elusimicrobia bacterium RIFOXYA2_FULL_58_8]|nr:MAG: 6-pyruvoyl tetrahydrobiopterin synthase [Elusimicrobia bacterium RIFOXYA12_FULL_57_11]OGS14569.1 MAG: 6-pyruvoyl tetrahydrobiopterin synthase [Elusimicrobia bacterium RIFOXYA2_FULL_58_8]